MKGAGGMYAVFGDVTGTNRQSVTRRFRGRVKLALFGVRSLLLVTVERAIAIDYER